MQINSKTKEIKEYEFQQGEGESGGAGKLKGKIMFLVAVASVAILAVKLVGIF